MSAVEAMQRRSAALRRMGIVEWLPRAEESALADDAASQNGDASVVPQPKAIVSERGARPAAAATSSPAAERDVMAVSSSPASAAQAGTLPVSATGKAAVAPAFATADSKPIPQVAPAQTASAQTVPASMPSLRGRLLRAGHQAPILVLALAEKNQRDALLHPDTAPGALLNAMLATLPAATSVALIGVERGEPIAVPATILVLGERSARALLGNDIAAPLRGRVHLFGQSRVVVSYHPDEARQNAALKRLIWDDLRLLAGLVPPSAAESP